MGIERATTALAALCVLCNCATAPATPDLATFLERRAMCEHFRGEFPDPPDPVRVREIEQQVDAYCTGTDAQLALLKARYRDDAGVTKQLAGFEPRIESTRR